MRLIDADSIQIPHFTLATDRIKMIDAIDEAATIEPKRGEWIPVKASIHPYGNDVKCSVCGHRMGSSFGYNFCPMCGASMREREGE